MGAGLLANAVYQSTNLLTDTPHSRASPLPQGFSPISYIAFPPSPTVVSVLRCPRTRPVVAHKKPRYNG
ncbi:hypothetical protein PspR76_28915 [Pseudomonas sp. R76]|nr:hypothetical protein PspR76_28915 [Pseudomonas sp. R76]